MTLNPKHTRLLRSISIVVVAAVLAVLISISATAKDSGVIVLRLDDSQGQSAVTREEPAREPAQPAAPAPREVQEQAAPTGEPPAVDVPASPGRTLPPPDLSSTSAAVIMDAETGQVLYEKNAHQRRPNASTTKIMTAVLAIENVGMGSWITASKNASETPYTSLHLKPGEKISAKDLLYGMLIRSANDAAVAFAEHIGGSVPKFAALMNRKAREIGCTDTHFVTPNGLYDKDHYSSAYDLALIARYAMRYQVFNEAIATRKHTLDSRTINRKDLAVFARSKFLRDYPGADGVKSGYVRQAGCCYVGSATHDGWRLVSAVLHSGDANGTTAKLMDYAFGGFRPYVVARAHSTVVGAKIAGGDAGTVAVAPVRDVRVIVPRTGGRVTTRTDIKPLEAPITKGTPVGTITAEVDGVPVSSVELRAADDVGISTARKLWWLAKACGIMIVGVGGIWYGAASAKGAGGRRRRVTTPLRGFDRYR